VLILYAGLLCWTLGYDTIYAHQDKEDDALIGVKSTALLLGAGSRKWILRFYAVSFTLILAAGFAEHAGWPFGFVLLLAGGHMLWQARRLKINDAGNCLMLFRANRLTGGLMALAFLAAAWLG
jgi:4-hydroxybenzoate polyprenyltransferase